MIELKPCPFCGSDRVIFVPDKGDYLPSDAPVFISCRSCGFTSGLFASEILARNLWNHRAGEEKGGENK